MIKHIVMWRLKEQANGDAKLATALSIKNKLESLSGKIPGLIKIEVGIDFSNTDRSSDLVLYSEFETKEALVNYQNHPEHQAIVPFVVENVSERRVVDYEVN
ncbi:MAG TPA: Dabb family protein [Bacillota bacterium]|nr:Dabb family protein [Bacillota bacterium]HOL11083.1 Dabb family protein [Bacillota bacterium]HPO97724.1 Dabb family protein [Bacillota bacterium]